jgi:hypothetical protein
MEGQRFAREARKRDLRKLTVVSVPKLHECSADGRQRRGTCLALRGIRRNSHSIRRRRFEAICDAVSERRRSITGPMLAIGRDARPRDLHGAVEEQRQQVEASGDGASAQSFEVARPREGHPVDEARAAQPAVRGNRREHRGVRGILLGLREGALRKERGAHAVAIDEMQRQLGEQMLRYGALSRARQSHERDDDSDTRLVLTRHVASFRMRIFAVGV